MNSNRKKRKAKNRDKKNRDKKNRDKKNKKKWVRPKGYSKEYEIRRSGEGALSTYILRSPSTQA